MSTDWFRNIEWNDEIESAFNRKLSRSKMQEQCIRVQASTLAKSHPEVSLKLLDRYFDMPDDFYHAQAYCDKATALLALGRIDEAVESYDAAIAREEEFPQLQTQAHLELPFTVAVGKLSAQYPRALEVLGKYEDRLLFPVDYFKWHTAHALIAADQDQPESAIDHAREALAAADRKHSGFDSHPKAGLVAGRFGEVKVTLKELVQ
jgi:tetratricopeptide (TPR) repeat protein